MAYIVVGESQIVLVALSCFFLFFFLLFRRRRRSPVHPISWPVLGMLPDSLASMSRIHDRATEVLLDAGCTFLVKGPWFTSMDVLLTCDPANVNHIFNANFPNYPKGAEHVEIFDILGGGIFNADQDSWKAQRRMTHGLMSDQRFRAYVAETSGEKVSGGIVPFLCAAVEDGSVVDLQDVFLRYTFDVTCLLVMGVDPRCLSPGLPVVPFAKAIDDAMEVLFLRSILPRSWFRAMRKLGVGPEKKLAAAWEAIDGFIEENVSKKKEELCNSTSPDMLTSCLNHAAGGKREELLDFSSKEFLRDMVVNLMLAGRDTTASALTWFFWLLSKNPHVEAKILQELNQFDEQSSSELVYLHAALCEALRLYPPVPFEQKTVVRPDVLPSGHRVVQGSKVWVSLYSMARAEGVWGKDCREFRPERWIVDYRAKDQDGKRKIRHEPSYKFMSFNCGPRTCLGKDIAFTQMKVVVVNMMKRFEVEVVGEGAGRPKPSILLHMKDGLVVRIRKRSIDRTTLT